MNLKINNLWIASFLAMTESVCHRQYAGRRIMWITPCKRSAARGKGNPPHPQPRSGLNSYGVPEDRGHLPTPSCASGLQGVITVKDLRSCLHVLRGTKQPG